jgi:phosphoglycolate phosphatase-like HAD superfamily hydrolase
MNIYVLDRDGVLFDTCRLNSESYIQASSSLGLQTNLSALDDAIMLGESIDVFFPKVWGDLSSSQLDELRARKLKFFKKNADLVRLNPKWIKVVKEVPEQCFIATRASLDSTNFLLRELLPEFQLQNVYSIQGGIYKSKGKVLDVIATNLQLSLESVTLYDDTFKTIKELKEYGYSAVFEKHFCGIHAGDA